MSAGGAAMTIALPWLGVEAALEQIRRSGFSAVEVFVGQITPPGGAPSPAQAAAVGDAARALGLEVRVLNAIDGPDLDPVGAPEAATERLGRALVLADAMGAEAVLVWDGFADAGTDATAAADRLARTLDAAAGASGLAHPAPFVVELHPFTWALRHGALAELRHGLARVGAGVCLDYCHFAVAMGAQFVDRLDREFLDGVTHVHWSDSDGATSELHFPPEAGCLDLDRIDAIVAATGPKTVAWDLYGWPAPVAALAEPGRFASAAARLAGTASAR